VISGAGGLIKVGLGTFTLTGANTYTGTTSVSAGTLTLGSSGRLAGPVVNDANFNSLGIIMAR
jgi:autotransporter-associated beta strand protein